MTKSARPQADQKISEHLHHVAQTLFELYKRDQFEWLILSGKVEYLKEFEAILHSYLRGEDRAHLDLPVDTPGTRCWSARPRGEEPGLQAALPVWRSCSSPSDRAACGDRPGGNAPAPQRRGRGDAGRRPRLPAGGSTCVSATTWESWRRSARCAPPMVEAPDVITLAVDRALQRNCEVQQVYEGVGMEKAGNIGALLRSGCKAFTTKAQSSKSPI